MGLSSRLFGPKVECVKLAQADFWSRSFTLRCGTLEGHPSSLAVGVGSLRWRENPSEVRWAMDQSERAICCANQRCFQLNWVRPRTCLHVELQAECPKHAQFRAIPKTQGALRRDGKTWRDAG